MAWRRHDDSARTRRKILISTQVGRSRSSEMGLETLQTSSASGLERTRHILERFNRREFYQEVGRGVPSCRRSRFVVSAHQRQNLGTDTAALVARRRSRAGGI